MGCAAGIAAMASVFFAVLAYLHGQALVTTLAAAVLARGHGISALEFQPAKILWVMRPPMFLGFLMATLGLNCAWKHKPFLLRGWLRFLSWA